MAYTKELGMAMVNTFNDTENKREHERIVCSEPVEYTVQKRGDQRLIYNSVRGAIKNMSLGGFYIKTERPMIPGEDAEFSLYSNRSRTTYTFSCNIVRRTDEGIGVKILEWHP